MTLHRLVRFAGIAAFALAVQHGALGQSDGYAQAEHRYKAGDLQGALARVEDHIAANPRDPRGKFLKGVILAEQKKTPEAIKVYTELTHEHPDLAEPYNNLAVLHAARGEYDSARHALEMAIRAKPDFAAAHENLGDIYARMAARAYEKAAKLDPGNKSAPVKLKQVTELLSAAR